MAVSAIAAELLDRPHRVIAMSEPGDMDTTTV
jgi:hypothetical protein